MLEYRMIVETSSGRIMEGGCAPYETPSPLPAGTIRVVFSRQPNQQTERYDAGAAGWLRAATAPELAAADASMNTVVAESMFVRGLQALAGALYKDVHGTFPNASQKAALKADFITAWKALG